MEVDGIDGWGFLAIVLLLLHCSALYRQGKLGKRLGVFAVELLNYMAVDLKYTTPTIYVNNPQGIVPNFILQLMTSKSLERAL